MKASVVALLSTALLVSLSLAEPVKLKLERPSKVGDKAEIIAKHTATGTQKVTVAGNVVQSRNTHENIVLEATGEVLAVSGRGKATKKKLAVKSLKFSDEKGVEPQELLASGKEVIAELKGDEVAFTVAGEAADDATAKALKTVIEMSADSGSDSSFDPDAIFNTTVPHAVGEDWDVDIAAMIKGAKVSDPFQFEAAGSSGKSRIEKLAKVEGIDCAMLSGTLDLKLAAVRGMPEGTKLVDGSSKIKFTAPVPLDETKPNLGGKITMKVAINADIPTPDGGTARLDIVNEIAKEESVKPLP